MKYCASLDTKKKKKKIEFYRETVHRSNGVN